MMNIWDSLIDWLTGWAIGSFYGAFLDLSIYVAKSSSFLVVCVFQEEEMQYKVKHPVVNPSHCLSVHRIHSVIPQSTQERHSITPPVASKRFVTRPRHESTGYGLLLAVSAFPLSGG